MLPQFFRQPLRWRKTTDEWTRVMKTNEDARPETVVHTCRIVDGDYSLFLHLHILNALKNRHFFYLQILIVHHTHKQNKKRKYKFLTKIYFSKQTKPMGLWFPCAFPFTIAPTVPLHEFIHSKYKTIHELDPTVWCRRSNRCEEMVRELRGSPCFCGAFEA